MYGHAFGDTVIKSFAATIQENFRSNDILGRIGGDEFVAFLRIQDYEWAKQKANSLCKALSSDHAWGSMNWHVSASIGVAFWPQHGTDYDTLYQNADAALYETKKRGRGGYTVYTKGHMR